MHEPFGDKSVCERYLEGVRELSSNGESKAAERVKGLLSKYFGDSGGPCDSRFSDVGYQLLTGTAGTVAVGRDFSVFYVMVFKTDSYDQGKGRENRLNYDKFIEATGGRAVIRGGDGFDAYELIVVGRRLICVYEYFRVPG